ncbi:hypothetical protein [Streptomyces microflavus]|uniref:hypothetical protein n=1 Tax=Streptomyces microflavus TaxID=1919 RepID=UPI0033DC0680
MIPSTTRLELIDRATDLVGDRRLTPTVLTAFVRHLRRSDLDVHNWHHCDDIATSASMSPHQARSALTQLVAAGLLERTVVPRRINGQDRRLVAYRLPREEAAK